MATMATMNDMINDVFILHYIKKYSHIDICDVARIMHVSSSSNGTSINELRETSYIIGKLMGITQVKKTCINPNEFNECCNEYYNEYYNEHSNKYNVPITIMKDIYITKCNLKQFNTMFSTATSIINIIMDRLQQLIRGTSTTTRMMTDMSLSFVSRSEANNIIEKIISLPCNTLDEQKMVTKSITNICNVLIDEEIPRVSISSYGVCKNVSYKNASYKDVSHISNPPLNKIIRASLIEGYIICSITKILYEKIEELIGKNKTYSHIKNVLIDESDFTKLDHIIHDKQKLYEKIKEVCYEKFYRSSCVMVSEMYKVIKLHMAQYNVMKLKNNNQNDAVPFQLNRIKKLTTEMNRDMGNMFVMFDIMLDMIKMGECEDLDDNIPHIPYVTFV